MKRSKLTERCALGHPKCSHTYGGKCYSVDMYVRGSSRVTPALPAHLLQDPGDIADDDPIRVNARCGKCKQPGFRLRSAYKGNKIPPLYVVVGSVVHTHVHKFDSHLRKWIIEEEPLS